MTESHTNDRVNAAEAKLPLWDWILLPLLCLLTACTVVGSTEWIARRIFTFTPTGLSVCSVIKDPAIGPRGIPNCVCWDKEYESHSVQYRLNSGGYRADSDFGPKLPGVYRIVLAGSSIPMGYNVDKDKTFATLLPGELSRRTGRPVELLNESFAGGSGVAQGLDEPLKANPDLILWVLTPWDIEQDMGVVHHATRKRAEGSFFHRAWLKVKDAFTGASFTGDLEAAFDDTRTSLLLRHFLFQSQTQSVKSYLISDDKESGFLKMQPSAEWEERLHRLSDAVARNEQQAKAAGVPLVVALIPNRTQAIMISMGQWPAGYNPYALGNELRSIVTTSGGTYVDLLSAFRSMPNPQQYYFPVDVHLAASGHAIVSRLLTEQLTDGAVTALRAAPQPQLAQMKES